MSRFPSFKTLVLPFVCAGVLAAVALYAADKAKPEPKKGSTIMNKEELKKKLTPLQYTVTVESGTERPFANEYWDNHAPGLYVDVISGEPLFASTTKFESGTGWPSFFAPVDKEAVKEVKDTAHGMVRVEVRSKSSDAHLGHVFPDGPKPTGQRYCMNSAAMKFIPVAKLKEAGLEKYLPLFEKADSAKAAQK